MRRFIEVLVNSPKNSVLDGMYIESSTHHMGTREALLGVFGIRDTRDILVKK